MVSHSIAAANGLNVWIAHDLTVGLSYTCYAWRMQRSLLLSLSLSLFSLAGFN